MNPNGTKIAATIIFLVLYVTGCGDAGNNGSESSNAKSDSGNIEDEFIAKINDDDDREICYGIDSILDLELVGQKDGDQYFINSNGMGFKPTEFGAAMLKLLVSNGYANPAPTKLKYQFAQRDAYPLTDKGRKTFVWGKNTCLGERTATSIVEYTEPSEMMGMTVTEVSFLYDIKFNDVVSELSLEDKLRQKLDGDDRALFVKTNKGWRLERGW